VFERVILLEARQIIYVEHIFMEFLIIYIGHVAKLLILTTDKIIYRFGPWDIQFLV